MPIDEGVALIVEQRAQQLRADPLLAAVHDAQYFLQVDRELRVTRHVRADASCDRAPRVIELLQ